MSPFGRKYTFQLEDILIRLMLSVCVHMSPVNGIYVTFWQEIYISAGGHTNLSYVMRIYCITVYTLATCKWNEYVTFWQEIYISAGGHTNLSHVMRIYCITVYTHMSPVNGMNMSPFGRKYTFQLEDILILLMLSVCVYTHMSPVNGIYVTFWQEIYISAGTNSDILIVYVLYTFQLHTNSSQL